VSPEFFHDTALNGALTLLPKPMDSLEARAMVLAICLQESKLQSRKQINGPARGYAQFEATGGVAAVLNHVATSAHTKSVCAMLDITPTQLAIYNALEHNDVLAAALARLLLWTLPGNLPKKNESELAWQQYITAWRPGKPHRETWDAYFGQAWAVVEENARQERIESQAVVVRLAAIQLIQGLNALNSAVDATIVEEASLQDN
jgi:hypothetical protein